jgi:hypothetical protein
MGTDQIRELEDLAAFKNSVITVCAGQEERGKNRFQTRLSWAKWLFTAKTAPTPAVSDRTKTARTKGFPSLLTASPNGFPPGSLAHPIQSDAHIVGNQMWHLTGEGGFAKR